jgi:hypothetical protein
MNWLASLTLKPCPGEEVSDGVLARNDLILGLGSAIGVDDYIVVMLLAYV